MEENTVPPQSSAQSSAQSSSFILPPHSNKMLVSIICALLCFRLGGIIAIVHSAKSNNLYNTATLSPDDYTKQMLYYQSEASNKSAHTWIVISLIVAVIYWIIVIILVIAQLSS